MKTVRLYSNERPALVDLLYAFSDTPRQAQSDISSLLVKNNEPRIISGFEASVSDKTLTVSQGSALLNFNTGKYIIKGLVVAADAGPQTFDLTSLGKGTFTVWVAFDALPSDLEARASSPSEQSGFDQNSNVFTRSSASFKVVVAADRPGADFAAIAQVELPSKTVTDARNFLFEGDAATDFAHTWGSDEDRSDARALNPISDLATMLDALKVAIEDIKGTHWWAATGAQGGGGGGGGGDGSGGSSGLRGSQRFLGNGPPPTDPAAYRTPPQAGDEYVDQDPNNPDSPTVYFFN